MWSLACGVSLSLSGGNSTRRRRVWGTHGDSEVGPGVNYEWEQNNATRRGVEWLAVLRQPPLLGRAVRRGGPRRRYNKTSGIKSHTQRGILGRSAPGKIPGERVNLPVARQEGDRFSRCPGILLVAGLVECGR